MVEPTNVAPFFAASWFFVAAALFVYKSRAFPRRIDAFFPITGYLLGIGVFFTLQGWHDLRETALVCPDALVCSDLGAGIAMMAGAAFISRFPLKSVTPDHADRIVGVLVLGAVASQVYLAFARPELVVAVANVFAFVFAGLVAVGYLVYRGLSGRSTLDWSLGVAMAPCCVVAHGLAGFGFAAVVSLPLVGIPLQTPLLFGVLAPLAVIGVLAFFTVLDREQTQQTPATGGAGGTLIEGTSAEPATEAVLGDGWPPTRNPGTVQQAIEAVEAASKEEFTAAFGPYLDALEAPQPGVDGDVGFVFLGIELGDGPTIAGTSAVRYVVEAGEGYRFVGNPEPPGVDLELHLPPQAAENGRELVLDHLQCQLRDLQPAASEKSSIYTLLDGVGKAAIDEHDIHAEGGRLGGN